MLVQNFGALRQYVPAELKHNSRGWYIEYHKFNPLISRFERVRVMLNRERQRCKTLVEFKLQTNALILQINNELAAGFVNTRQNMSGYGFASPDADMSENIRFHTPLEEVIKLYEEDRKCELSAATMRSYSCFCKQFREWVHKHYPALPISKFTQIQANQYMEFVLTGRSENEKRQEWRKLTNERVSPRTYNNNIKLGRALFSWAIEKSYARINPFEKLKQKKAQGKGRTIIPKEDRDKIAAYFKEHNPAFIIVMQLVYKSFLRPVEITRVKVNQINFEKHCIEMKGSQKKNGKDHNSRLDEELENLLREYIRYAKPNDYLFTRNWRPGDKPISSHTFSVQWDRMREQLHLTEKYQLYSLRDSGITSLLRAGAKDLDVVQIVGHSDLSMTFRYANHIDEDLIERVNKIAPAF